MEAIIKLRKSNLMGDGICIYEDQYGNSVFMKKEDSKDSGEEFVAKLRFKDKSIKAKPITVTVPVKDDEMGTMLHIDYLEGEKAGDEIDSAIDMFTKVMQRWINLMYDIAMLRAPSSGEADAKARLEKLSKYEELSDFIGILMKN
ncbi:MAG: hypothetical protein J6M44_10600 [Butyrivibrio sp.]|uniref:hypothetical protein n=1 Tax=Butyrivibrio sp. TaxID=28121 RepID=UPI001B5F1BB2|nr:hypothetical protein [Butyrivibrio sp.]MBP3279392.1 hypothetical protein [Butyrivibrio sp.]MBP3784563.1 hypothetical protein [Butyrivibrio sp.]